MKISKKRAPNIEPKNINKPSRDKIRVIEEAYFRERDEELAIIQPGYLPEKIFMN